MTARLLAAVAAAAVLSACGGGGSPEAAPTTVAPTTTPPRPTPTKPKPTPTPTRTPSPTPRPTTPPPAVGDVVGTAGATFSLAADPGAPRKVGGGADCAAVFSDLARVRCGAVKLDGGDLLWATGALPDGVVAARLYVLDHAAGGYVLRYEGRDDAHRWVGVHVRPGALAGHGTDGLVFVFRLSGTPGETSYDVLTWVKGGPLVLRAHRPPLADGRVAVLDGWVDEYAAQGDGTYARRRMVWDGRHFRLAPPVGVPAARVPGY